MPKEIQTLNDFSVFNEQIVLATLVQDNKNLYKYIKQIKSYFFVNKRHKTLFEILNTMVLRKMKFNVNTFIELAGSKDYGGSGYLEKLLEIHYEDENIEYHIGKLIDTYTKVRIHNNQVNEFYDSLFDPQTSISDISEMLKLMLEDVKHFRTETRVKKNVKKNNITNMFNIISC